MRKIHVDIENLNSAVSYFILASKELDELNYRLKQVGNEMIDDLNLQMAPEYNSIIEIYSDISKNIALIKELFECVLTVVTKVPELYSDVERKSIERINSLIYKNEKYQSALIDDKALEEIIALSEHDDNSEKLIDMIERNLIDLSFSNATMFSNDASNKDES